jgi:hypothetical protein
MPFQISMLETVIREAEFFFQSFIAIGACNGKFQSLYVN